jgi:TatD DNase family protein
MIDAHCHLHFPQLHTLHPSLAQKMRHAGITAAIVNGTCEADWPNVFSLCQSQPQIFHPAYGVHPWKIADISPKWAETLEKFLRAEPNASIGECGIDHWRKDIPKSHQREIFAIHAALSCKHDRPMSIHGLQAWGAVHEVLAKLKALPPFLLHSYSGPREMIVGFAAKGAYFSFSAYFLEPRKAATREMFRHIPLDRLLLETDAPDMKGPASLFPDHHHHPFHHPLALPRTAELLADHLAIPPALLIEQTTANAQRLFRLDPHSAPTPPSVT